jgi:hypothetical protein
MAFCVKQLFCERVRFGQFDAAATRRGGLRSVVPEVDEGAVEDANKAGEKQ